MAVVRYRVDIDITSPGRDEPGPPMQMVERALVLALCKLQVSSLGRRGRINLTDFRVEDFTLNDRMPTRAEQHELYQGQPPTAAAG
jgi:hypothetical protein